MLQSKVRSGVEMTPDKVKEWRKGLDDVVDSIKELYEEKPPKKIPKKTEQLSLF